MKERAALVMPAAGAGRRIGERHKPFLELAGAPLLLHALRPFLSDARIELAVIALPQDIAADPPAWLREVDERVRLVAGGRERGDSVYAALAQVPDDIDVVLVHDAARPLVSHALVAAALDAAARGRCVIAAVPAADTIQQVDAQHRIVATLERASLWQAQTPQAFPRALLSDAYARAARDGIQATDDAALVLHYGGRVHVIEGARENLKVTVPSDLIVAEALLHARAAQTP